MCITKKVKIFKITIDQYHYYLPVVIYFKCIYNSLYSYLQSNNILSESQSGFRKGDSCISQLLDFTLAKFYSFKVTHKIYANFDPFLSLKTRGVFWTYLKLLIEFGMKAYCISLYHMV